MTVERLFPDSCLGRPQVCLTLMEPCNSRGFPAYEQADVTAVNLWLSIIHSNMEAIFIKELTVAACESSIKAL